MNKPVTQVYKKPLPRNVVIRTILFQDSLGTEIKNGDKMPPLYRSTHRASLDALTMGLVVR